MPQAQTGTKRSIPKICKISGDDNAKVMYKNMGNNHAYPFFWSETVTLSGTDEATVCSGLSFHGYDLASYGNFVISPLSDVGAGTRVYIDKDTAANVVKIKSTASITVDFDVMVMVGSEPSISTLYCRGAGSPMPSLP